MKTKACVFWLVGLLLIMMVSSAMAQTPTPLSGPGPFVITAPGEYVLQNDIINSASTKVIEIKCSEVLLDGNGYTIDGVGTTGTYGISIWSGSASTWRSNITVKNLKITEFDRGIYLRNIDKFTMTGGKISQNGYAGFYALNLTNGMIYNNKFNNTANTVFSGTTTAIWNVSPRTGPNIVGGPSIGGNYWGNLTGTGFSDTATDTSPPDGFADSPYTVKTGTFDTLPLVKPSGPPPSQPIIADFSAAPIQADAPFDLVITDMSTGQTINYWCWTVSNTSHEQKFEFSTSPAPFPVHIAVPGMYSVNLTVSDGVQSNTKVRLNYVYATEPPLVADFVADQTVGNVPMEVHFTDLSQGTPTGWHWNFGDGSTPVDAVQDPDHLYEVPGVYTVTLTAVKAAIGVPPVISHAVKLNYIFVKGPMPDADFSIDQPSQELPSKVHFTDTSTGEVVSVRWDFGDGGWMEPYYGGGTPDPEWMTVRHTYPNPGTYPVTLTAWNSWGDQSSETYYVEVIRPLVSTIYFMPDTSYIELDANKPQYINVQLALSEADEQHGFSGYTMDLTTTSLDTYGRSEFTSLAWPEWAIMREKLAPPLLNESSPSPVIALKAADLDNMVQPGWWNIPLAKTSVNAMEPGVVEINANVLKLNDEAGGALPVVVIPGEVHVYAFVRPFNGMLNPPTDPDQDHLFEDINGNQNYDYADVVIYFQQMEQIPYFETVKYFDYNGNGRIDFNDVYLLFQEQ